MQFLYIVLLIIFSYLLGSVPNGLVIGKLFKQVDIREHGSKNTGATNSVRVLGLKLGALVFLLDALKGAIVIAIVRILMHYGVTAGNMLGYITVNGHNVQIYAVYGLFAVLGHVFPIFLKFKGGKAVATSVGALAAVAPVLALIGGSVFYVVLKVSGYASLGSLYGASTALVLMIIYDLFMGKADYGVLYFEYNSANWIVYSFEIIMVFFYVFIIFMRHRENIKKLNEGTERQFTFKDEE